MDGVLIIDKPAGPTSHDIVNQVRRVFATRKVGHTGTLDPFATGVMVVLVGRATRLAKFVDKEAKEYEAEIRFGFATDTGDLTGKPLGEVRDVPIAAAELDAVLAKFRGEILQKPPMYSAKKVGGKKLYEFARRGEDVERPAVPVTIFEIELIDAHAMPSALHTVRVRCSAGTYIRTLAEDIAASLGTFAHLTALRRTASGRFHVGQSVSPNVLADSQEPAKFLLPIETLVEDLPRFILSNEREKMTLNGLSSRVYEQEFAADASVAMFSEEERLVAVGRFDAGDRSIRPTLVLGENK